MRPFLSFKRGWALLVLGSALAGVLGALLALLIWSIIWRTQPLPKEPQ